jgi:hypothetical protein
VLYLLQQPNALYFNGNILNLVWGAWVIVVHTAHISSKRQGFCHQKQLVFSDSCLAYYHLNPNKATWCCVQMQNEYVIPEKDNEDTYQPPEWYLPASMPASLYMCNRHKKYGDQTDTDWRATKAN